MSSCRPPVARDCRYSVSNSSRLLSANRSGAAPARGRVEKFLPLWLFVLALGIRLLIIPILGLDGLYGQDAFAYMGCVHELVRMHWGEVPCGDLYWPLGYPLLAALFTLVTHSEPAGAQLASTVAGATVAPLAYWMVIESGAAATVRLDAGTHRRATAALDEGSIAAAAGLIAGVCGALILSSMLVMSDAAGLFWASLSVCLLLRWDRAACDGRAQTAWLLLAAAALALAVVTRWIFTGLLIPVGAFLAVAAARRPGAARSRSSVLLRGIVLPGAGAALVFALIVVPQLYINLHSSYPLSSDSWIVSWNLANAWRTSFDTGSGHFTYPVPPLLYNAAPLFYPIYMFPLLTPFVFYGAWQLRRSRSLILLAGWPVTLYLYLIGTSQENLRFSLAFFTPVAVLAVVGLFCMRARLATSHRWLLLVLSLVLAAPFTYRAIARFGSALAQQLSAIRYVQSQVPSRATVVTFELSISLQYYTDLVILDLSEQSPQSLRQHVCRDGGAYLYVDGAKLESQWVGKSPDQGFRWLRERIGLARIGQQGAWTLFRIGPCSP